MVIKCIFVVFFFINFYIVFLKALASKLVCFEDLCNTHTHTLYTERICTRSSVSPDDEQKLLGSGLLVKQQQLFCFILFT